MNDVLVIFYSNASFFYGSITSLLTDHIGCLVYIKLLNVKILGK